MATEKAKARKAAVGMEAAAEVEMREATTKTRLAGLAAQHYNDLARRYLLKLEVQINLIN